MDPVRLGNSFRALRIRKGMRQVDLSAAAGVSRGVVSSVELGRMVTVRVGDLRRIAETLEADLDVRLRWRGEGLDRLLDQGHAGLVEGTVELLRRAGWQTAVEVSFSLWGERGSLDVLARHRASGTVLVVEVKSVVPDSQAMLHGLDRKARLAPEIAVARGWACSAVARLLVVGDSSTSRRRISALGATYSLAFPSSGQEVRRWISAPSGGGMSGLLFLPYGPGGTTSRWSTGIQRVRKPGIRPRAAHSRAVDADGKASAPGTR